MPMYGIDNHVNIVPISVSAADVTGVRVVPILISFPKGLSQLHQILSHVCIAANLNNSALNLRWALKERSLYEAFQYQSRFA
jgi:hypothetical protein